MKKLTMIIRHICFSGPDKEPSYLKFGYGLNLVYGASNTGKSSVLDAIDYMLGRESELKEVKEHVGYDRILLGIEFSNKEKITLIRSISGGDFQCFQGLHLSLPEKKDFQILKEKKSTKKIKSVSDFILEKLDLNNKKLKRNAKNETDQLTLRTLLPLSLISEANIQKDISPFHTIQYTKSTVEKSRLKLLLGGTDDSSLVSNKDEEKNKISHEARIEVLKELIEDQREKLALYSEEEYSLEDLLDQKNKLMITITDYQYLLQQTENDYLNILENLNTDRVSLRRNNEKLKEVKEMLIRFDLLKQHYDTDIMRLDGIIESGSLITAMLSVNCPLCGADKDNQNLDHECDGNIDITVEAAKAEVAKINILKSELRFTIDQLSLELSSLERTIPKIQGSLEKHQKHLSILSPDLSEKRVSYSELKDKSVDLEKAIDQTIMLASLEKKLKAANNNNKVKSKPSKKDETKIPTSTLDELAITIQSFLKMWGLPNVDRIHFDVNKNDLVINGKHRVSNGKGHRSITHAAMTLGLMKYLEDKKLPSVGFTILDSPLLAYEEPDDDEDDLNGTDVNECFFDSLVTWETRQTIIFENKKSIPQKMENGDQITFFSGNKLSGRYGFFPITK